MANMLFIESPICVGFSYPYSMDCSSYQTDDNTTKHDNLEALYSFFDKFPEFGNRPFYITGESYIGHYGPQLAALIIEQNQNPNAQRSINLQGVALGNPYINRDNNWFEGWIPTMYSLGIINDEAREKLLGQCHNRTFTGKCANSSWTLVNEYLYDLNRYDIDVPSNVRYDSVVSSHCISENYSSPETFLRTPCISTMVTMVTAH